MKRGWFSIFIVLLVVVAIELWSRPERVEAKQSSSAARTAPAPKPSLKSRTPASAPRLTNVGPEPLRNPEQDFDTKLGELVECADREFGQGLTQFQRMERRNPWRGAIGDWYTTTNDELKGVIPVETSIPGRFLLAMSRMGLFAQSTSGNLSQNLPEAKRLLEGVHAEDPLNSAPVLLLMAVERDLGDTERSDYWKAKLENTKYYSDYRTDLNRLALTDIRTPEDLYHGVGFQSLHPVLSGESIGLLLIHSGTKKVATQMMNIPPGRLIHGIDWDMIQLGVARNALIRMGVPKEKLASYEEPHSRTIEPLPNTCVRADWEKAVQKYNDLLKY